MTQEFLSHGSSGQGRGGLEQVRMSARLAQDQLRLGRLVDQQPIRFDMAISPALESPAEGMVFVMRGQWPARTQRLDDHP